MKSLAEVKNEVAKKHGYNNWTAVQFYAIDAMAETTKPPYAEEALNDEVAILFAKECLEEAAIKFTERYFTRWPSYKGRFTSLEWNHIFLEFAEYTEKVKPAPTEGETFNCSVCGKPLIKKMNTTVKDESALQCHDCWDNTWSDLFQLIREGKYDLVKQQFDLTRK